MAAEAVVAFRAPCEGTAADLDLAPFTGVDARGVSSSLLDEYAGTCFLFLEASGGDTGSDFVRVLWD